MTRITYSKEFLDGNLKGITVRCGFDVPADAVALRMQALNAITKANPGHDASTGAAFWIYNLGCEDDAERARNCRHQHVGTTGNPAVYQCMDCRAELARAL